ncbi:Suppressor of the cold-sensitive snRNP bioproteinsis mutant brr1-1 [Perkinsus chesapeaki]|uniref:subtilisin n=1 Tax=Perkinsus chesapeaki TaxID=330153 RepID=A0A7J6L905_PERCH|nr:Suppressor of the cold-sensitive snRNP bioproteinsis mutant brr1-1 [Perkinsus chesapeaki]
MVTNHGESLDSRHLPRMLTRALGTSRRLSEGDLKCEECLMKGGMVEDLSAIGIQVISSRCPATVSEISNYMKRAEDALNVVTLVEPDGEVYLQDTSERPPFAQAPSSCGVNPRLGTNDPESGCQTNLETIRVTAAWELIRKFNRTRPLEEVVVAVIDSGVDTKHPDLIKQFWRHPVDGSIGYNFIENNTDVTDLNGHGTVCAGIIAAETNNSIGVAGIAGVSNVKLMILRFLDEQRLGFITDALRALNFAVKMGAQISSNSYGSYSDSVIYRNAVINAAAKGHVVITVSGNDGLSLDTNPVFPCSYVDVPTLLCTAATNSGPNIALYPLSNVGSAVNILAPGINIRSTFPGGYDNLTGTSAAGPHVAATAALLASLGLKGQEIRDSIVESARSVLDNQPPLLDAGEAVMRALSCV